MRDDDDNNKWRWSYSANGSWRLSLAISNIMLKNNSWYQLVVSDRDLALRRGCCIQWRPSGCISAPSLRACALPCLPCLRSVQGIAVQCAVCAQCCAGISRLQCNAVKCFMWVLCRYRCLPPNAEHINAYFTSSLMYKYFAAGRLHIRTYCGMLCRKEGFTSL